MGVRQGILAGISKSSRRERDIRINTIWNAWHMMGQLWKAKGNFKFKCNVFMATVQVALLTGLCTFAGQNGSITACEAPRCDDEDKLGH